MQQCRNAMMHECGSAEMQTWGNAGRSARGVGLLHYCTLAFLHCCLFIASPVVAYASERYALVVTGASGGEQYARKYDAWRTSFVTTLRETFHYPTDHLVVLAENESDGILKATRENVRRVVAGFVDRASKDDVVTVLLIGHGAGDSSDEAKFNLVGPDLSAAEWAALFRPLAAKLLFIDASSGSFPFLEKLSGNGRIVVTANDSAAQQYETVFPEFFVKAFEDGEADFDKNGRVSLWEAFEYSTSGVRRWFEERGQLATERPLLDDSGDGMGGEADTPGPDGAAARVTYLQPERPIVETADAELNRLRRRRAELDAQLEELKARKPGMAPDDYDRALEKLLLEIAQIDRQIRSRS